MLNSRTKRVVGLLMLVLSLAACQEKKSSTTVSQSRYTRAAGVSQGTQSTGITSLTGYVYADESYQQQFQEAVVGFLDASVPADYVGYVSAMGRNNTGVYFGGRVQLSSGALRGAVSGQVSVQTTSRLLITVYDEFTGQKDSSGQTIPPVPVYFPNAQGYVTGNTAVIRFQDDYGWVEMQGQFDNSHFRGTMTWDNQRRYDGAQGSAGTLGSFEVPTCEFFLCN